MRSVRILDEALKEALEAAAWYQAESRFPYDVVVVERQNETIVVAFAHHSRQPGYGRDRLRVVRLDGLVPTPSRLAARSLALFAGMQDSLIGYTTVVAFLCCLITEKRLRGDCVKTGSIQA